MRWYVPNALPWASATFAAALIAQFSSLFVPDVTADTGRQFPQLIWVVEILRPIVGWAIAFDVLTALPNALCVGIAWSVPQALAFPGPRSARAVWVIALMLTGFVVVVMVKSLSRGLLRAFFLHRVGLWMPSITSYALPVFLAWLILSLVSGTIMYWNLRRGSPAGISQVYVRFD